jgi:hypothetical protein
VVGVVNDPFGKAQVPDKPFAAAVKVVFTLVEPEVKMQVPLTKLEPVNAKVCDVPIGIKDGKMLAMAGCVPE